MAVRRVARLAGLATASVFLIGAIAVVGVIKFGWGRAEIRSLIERQATAALNGSLHIDSVSGSLINGVTLHGVRFVVGGQDVVTARSLDVQLSLWRWLRGGREVTAVRLVDPVVRLTEHDQDWDASRWVKGGGGGGASTSVSLPRIEIVNGRLLLTAREKVWRLPADVRDLNARLAISTDDGARLDIQQLSFSTVAEAGGAPFQARRVSGALHVKNGATLESIRVESDAGTMSVSGRVGPTAPRVLQLSAALDRVDTTRWRTFTSLLDTVTLTASGTLAFSGPVDALKIQSSLATNVGRIGGTTSVDNLPDRLRITNDLQVSAFNAEHVMADAVWASALTGRVRFAAESRVGASAWTVAAKLNGGPFRAFGADLDQVDGELTYANDRVTFTTAADAYGATAHGTGTIVLRPSLTIDVAADRVARLDFRRLPASWKFVPLEADMAATALAVHWTDGHWTLDTTLDDSRVEGATFERGTTMKVESEPDNLRIAAEGRVRALDARRMGTATGLTGLDDPIFVTDLNGRFRVTGQGRDLAGIDLAADADLQQSRAAAGAAIANATVTYTRKAHANTARISGSIAHLNPTSLGASSALASDINGRADLTAEWRDDVTDVAASMTASGTLQADASTVSELPLTDGTVTGEWRDGRFRIDQAVLRNRGVRATARGVLAVTRGASAVTFDVAVSDVGALEPWTGRRATGRVSGNGTLDGAFDAPHMLATFSGPGVSDPDLGDYATIRGRADVIFPEWYLDKMHGDIAFDAATWTSASGTRADALTSRNRFTTRMTVSESVITARVQDAAVRATISADWTAETTAVFHALEVARGTERWTLAPSTRRFAVTTSHVEAADAVLTNGAQRIAADGRVAWSALSAGGGAEHLEVRATDVELAGLAELFALSPGAEGRVSGHLSLDGRLSDPRGRLTITGRNLSVRGYRIDELSGEVALAGGAADTSLTAKQPDGLALRAVGRAPLSWLLPEGTLDTSVPSPSWDLVAVSDPINLDIFSSAAPSLSEIGGQALVDVRVTGAADAPALNGTLAIADGRFRIPSAGTAFSNVFADIGFGADVVTVRRFTARDKRAHTLTVKGQLAVNARQVDRVDVNLDADRLLVVDNAIGTIELSSLLELKGSVSAPRLSGNIEVATGRVEVDRLLRVLQGDPQALIAETDLPVEGTTRVDLRAEAAAAAIAEAKAASAPAFDSRSFLSSLAVDVQVFAPDNLVLRGSKLRPGGRNSWSLGDLNVTVGADLSAQRAPGESVHLLGDVTTIRGSYTFESRRFEIQRGGRIRFQGETPLDPSFDVRGVRTIDGVDARVDVRGRLSSPRLQLGSNLPLDEADVLSMIIFNRPVNQLGETQRADLVGAAASLAGGFVTAPLAQSLGRALDLDLLEVETVSFGQNVAPRIRVGQRLTNRLFVQLSQQFGAQSVSELTAEYQLARFLRLQGSTAQGPGSRAQRSLLQRSERVSLDLLFFFNY